MATFGLQAEIPNIRLSREGGGPNEVSIAINPADPLQMAVGSNPRYFYRSSDGGLSWIQSELPRGSWGDPSVAFDSKGMLYYAHLANLPTGYFIDRLIVRRSTDGGEHWVDSSEVGFNPPLRGQDKEYLAADLTDSPHRDNIYMAWTQFDRYGSTHPGDSSRILFARSTDRGATWSEPIRVSDAAGDCRDDDETVEGAVPAVGPGGEIYLCWSGPAGILCDRSTDGGRSFGQDLSVVAQPGGWNFPVPGIFRCNGFPVTAVDVSSSPHRGTVYVAWSDQRNGPDNTDVFLARSTDGAASWSLPRRVNTDTTVSHQFFPWMTVDRLTGTVSLVFYDRSRSAGNATEVTVAVSTDGGETFVSRCVSESPFLPDQSVFFGDYTGIAASGGRIVPVWTRMDDRELSVWVALLSEDLLVSVPAAPSPPTAMVLDQNYPNPFNPVTTITFEVSEYSSAVRLRIFDLLGRVVGTLVDGPLAPGRYPVTYQPTGLASGVYVYRLEGGGVVLQRAMLYAK